jgi:hypothetical protein
MGREYDAAGEYLIMNGFNCGDTIPAAKVQVLLANFHSENLGVVNTRFNQWWKDNITHARKEDTSEADNPQ